MTWARAVRKPNSKSDFLASTPYLVISNFPNGGPLAQGLGSRLLKLENHNHWPHITSGFHLRKSKIEFFRFFDNLTICFCLLFLSSFTSFLTESPDFTEKIKRGQKVNSKIGGSAKCSDRVASCLPDHRSNTENKTAVVRRVADSKLLRRWAHALLSRLLMALATPMILHSPSSVATAPSSSSCTGP